MKPLRIRRLVLAISAFAAIACGEIPTAPNAEQFSGTTADRLTQDRGRMDAIGGLEVRCVLGRTAARGPVGWESRRMAVRVPVQAGVRTLRYRYAMVSRTGRIVRIAECDVPATRAAIRRLDAILGANVPGAHRREASTDASSDVRTRGCVSDGECEIEGIVVTVPETDGCPYVYTGGCDDPFGGPVGGTPPDVSGGGGGGGSGNTGWGPAGSAFDGGPLLWAGCILTVTGSGVSIWQVAERFEDWYEAYKARTSAERMLQAVRENNPSPEMLQLYQYMLQQAQSAESAAVGAVSEATRVSYLALGFAAVACGATVIIPSP